LFAGKSAWEKMLAQQKSLVNAWKNLQTSSKVSTGVSTCSACIYSKNVGSQITLTYNLRFQKGKLKKE
jgi:hypothetical protein